MRQLGKPLPVMFLGGPLDHATRKVIGSVTMPGRPAAPTVEAADTLYRLHKIDIEGLAPWWIYVMEGYAPPRQHVLNTCPNPRA